MKAILKPLLHPIWPLLACAIRSPRPRNLLYDAHRGCSFPLAELDALWSALDTDGNFSDLLLYQPPAGLHRE